MEPNTSRCREPPHYCGAKGRNGISAILALPGVRVDRDIQNVRIVLLWVRLTQSDSEKWKRGGLDIVHLLGLKFSNIE
jgi:hypothetical protein